MANNHITKDQEIWKAIPDFPGYEVSTHGRIRSYWHNRRGIRISHQPRILSTKGGNKYPHVGLTRDKTLYHFSVHTIVLTAFVGTCPPGMEACHNNGNRFDNRLFNLRWDTRKNNVSDKFLHGVQPMGENQWNCKLTSAKVVDIREQYSRGMSQYYLAEQFGICQSHISHIVARKCWKHISSSSR
jgi:hypothetical protein